MSPRRASAAILAIAVPFSALALGGLHTPILCGVAALLAVAAFVGWFPGAPLRPRLPATIVLAAGLSLTAFTALQALSLPAVVVRALSPAAAEVWAGALAPLHEPGPAWTTLSLDPIATRIQVVRGVAYLAAFLVALRIAEHRGGTRFLSAVVIATALALAMSAVLHPLVGAERVFGVYKPVAPISERHIAPLLNANHLAAYINIGFCLALGMAFDRRAERYRPIAIAVAALLIATQLWVASRGGTLAMVFGAICVLLMASMSKHFAVRTSASFVLPAVIVASGIGMVVLGSIPEAATELSSADVSKIRIALSAFPLALRYPFFGVGRGAFEVAFPSVRQDEAGYVSFTHPENLPIQWVTEWGIPAALFAFLALGAAFRPKVLMVSSSPAIGAWSAIATVAVENLLDFNSEVPAVGIAMATCAAMVVAGRGNARDGWVHSWGSRPRTVAATIGVASIASIAIALAGWPHELAQDRVDVYARASREPSRSGGGDSLPRDVRDFRAEERQALLRHPAEAYLPFIGASNAARQGENVIPWVERTLTLSPIYGPAHFLLAAQLERLGPAQARLEYRLAITQDGPLYGRALLRATPLIRSFDDALELAPTNASRIDVLSALAQTPSFRERLPATRERLDELLRTLDPKASAPLDRVVSEVSEDLRAGEAAPWCRVREECARPGLAAVSQLAALTPGQCGPHVARARLKIAAGDGAAALRELQSAAQEAIDPPECWRSLGELALTLKSDSYADAAEEAMTRSACSADSDCANNLVWAASLEERRGNFRRAIGYYGRAQAKAPERTDLVERAAHLASGLGMHAEALDAYRKLARSTPNGGRWQNLADQEKIELLHERDPALSVTNVAPSP